MICKFLQTAERKAGRRLGAGASLGKRLATDIHGEQNKAKRCQDESEYPKNPSIARHLVGRYLLVIPLRTKDAGNSPHDVQQCQQEENRIFHSNDANQKL